MSIIFAQGEERRGTGNIKWDLQGPLPFGIADMDIESPPCVINAMQERLNHHFYGYGIMKDSLREAIVAYLAARHGVQAKPEWLHELPGCVPAFMLVARSVCKPGDNIMVCTPAYPPMLHCHESAGATLTTLPYKETETGWTFDWEAMEAAVRPETRLFLLCNPHNPLGCSWTPAEMERLGDFCERHDLILCSDEIHCDLVLDKDARHISALTLPERLLKRVVMLAAPSKTFNIAGLGFTYMAVPDAELRERICTTQGGSLPTINVLAYAAAEAAYREGWGWHAELLETLRQNREFTCRYLEAHLPQLRIRPQQSTYLLWIDCSALGVDCPHDFFREKAGVYLDNGVFFGDKQCVRLNFACSPDQLKQGLIAMRKAVAEL